MLYKRMNKFCEISGCDSIDLANIAIDIYNDDARLHSKFGFSKRCNGEMLDMLIKKSGLYSDTQEQRIDSVVLCFMLMLNFHTEDELIAELQSYFSVNRFAGQGLNSLYFEVMTDVITWYNIDTYSRRARK